MALEEESVPPAGLHGHRDREVWDDLGRILALSDGVFAFAMTLLVLSLVVPTRSVIPAQNGPLANYLLTQWTSLFAYALSFFIIGTWWIAHQRLFRRIRRCDRPLTLLNLAFLLFISITPFVVGVLVNYNDTAVGVGTYAATQALAGVMLLVLWLYLHSAGRELVGPGVTDTHVLRNALIVAIVPIGFGLSIPLAFLSPAAALYSWIAIFVVRALVNRRWKESESSSTT